MLATVLSASACVGTPAVLRSMTSLPDDRQKQHEQNDSALARPGDDQDRRKPLPGKLAGVETAAASVAAIVGMLYSTSPNVILGTETRFEENLLFDPLLGQRPKGGGDPAEDEDEDKDEDNAASPTSDGNGLVPWIRLAPPAK